MKEPTIRSEPLQALGLRSLLPNPTPALCRLRRITDMWEFCGTAQRNQAIAEFVEPCPVRFLKSHMPAIAMSYSTRLFTLATYDTGKGST